MVMDMPLARNFTGEPHAAIMYAGIFWVVSLNSAILTWLGVVAGQIIISNCGSFFDVLNTSLSVFIVLQIDDQVLPFTRWMVEVRGETDHKGVLPDNVLRRLTHGNQYYKPGYGHDWSKKLRDKRFVVRLLPIPLFIIVTAIIAVPAAATIAQAVLYLQICPDF